MLHTASQHRGRTFGESPTRRHFARLHHAGGRKDPQLVRQSPPRNQIEFRLPVHALFNFGKLPQHAAIGEQSTSAEIPTGVLFKQRACRVAQVRLMHGNQFRFNLRFARQ